MTRLDWFDWFGLSQFCRLVSNNSQLDQIDAGGGIEGYLCWVELPIVSRWGSIRKSIASRESSCPRRRLPPLPRWRTHRSRGFDPGRSLCGDQTERPEIGKESAHPSDTKQNKTKKKKERKRKKRKRKGRQLSLIAVSPIISSPSFPNFLISWLKQLNQPALDK